jgi:hypothetical protein
MKKFLLLAACIFISRADLSAQQYYPLLDSVNVWHYTGNQLPVSPPPPSQFAVSSSCSYPNYGGFGVTNMHYTGNDTTINSIDYKQLMLGDMFSNFCLYGFIREDTSTRKIYFKDVTGASETLIYDFSMQTGDSISLNFYVNGYFSSGFYRLDSITNVNIKAGTRRAFHLNCHTCSPNKTLTWIESVGNLGDVIYTYSANSNDGGNFGGCPGFPHQFFQIMTCFDHNEIIYYDSCAYQEAISSFCFNVLDTCNYFNTCGSVEELFLLSDVSVSPNPSAGNINLNMHVENPVAVDLFVWDITGKQLLKKIAWGQLTRGRKTKELNLSSLLNGFYLLECRTKEGSIFKKIILEK